MTTDQQPQTVTGVHRRIGADPNEDDPPPGASVPVWFARFLLVATAAVVCFGGVGLLLAFFGHYRLAIVLPIGAVATIVGAAIAWPRRDPEGPSSRGTTWAAVAMIAVAVVSGLANGARSSQHVLVGRDPGVYTATAKWIDIHGNLEIHVQPEWLSNSANVVSASPGAYVEGDRLEFQFNHLMPVLMAEADGIGGDRLLFRVPALLGALALCAIFAVGCRLIRRPWLVLAAVVALGISLPQLNVSRDTLSETSVEFLLWAGIWLLLLAYERRRLGLAVLAGAALGATLLGRIDALIYLIPLPVLAAVALLPIRPRADRRSLVRIIVAIIGAGVPIAVLGIFDVRNRAGSYYDDLGSQVHQLQAAFVVSTVLSAAILVIWPRLGSSRQRLATWSSAHRESIARILGGLTAFGLLAVWAVRPAIDHPTESRYPLVGALQQLVGLPVDPSRTYGEQSLNWISWYLGPVTVGLAIVGATVLVVRIARRPEPASVVILAMAGIGTALYLWQPSILPDQIWAMRRFVPAGLPLFALLAAVAIDTVVRMLAAQRGRNWARTALVIGAAALVFFPAAITRPVVKFRPQADYLHVVLSTCKVTGPNAAIAFVANNVLGEQLALSTRSWCNVPVATFTSAVSAAQLATLADQWKAQGRTLWVMGTTPAVIAKNAGGTPSQFVGAANDARELETVIERAPKEYSAQPLTMYAGQVAG